MKLILASNNKDKVLEFREILAGTGIEVIPQREAGCDFEVDETGETFEENAFLKAEAAMKATGLPAVSDDSGLEVDALGGAPGVHSARYTGNHDDSDLDRRKFLMKNLEGEEHRTARFVSAICCVFPNGDVLRARGTCEGSHRDLYEGRERLRLRRHVHRRGREPHHGRDDPRGKERDLAPGPRPARVCPRC